MICLGEKNIALSYISSGKFMSSERWTHLRRQITSYEIIYVLNGEIYIQEEETQFALTKGSVLILHPDRVHFGYKESTEPTSFFWLHFQVSDFEGLGLSTQQFLTPDTNLLQVFQSLVHTVNTEGYPPYTADLLTALILSDLHKQQAESGDTHSRIVNEIAEWIRINIESVFTLSDIARHFGYSPNYLSAIFKANKGVGIKGYINTLRIAAAKQLLLTTGYSIKQIASLLNYDNENQFINYFKYHEKVSPFRFRNTYYNTHLNNDKEQRRKPK